MKKIFPPPIIINLIMRSALLYLLVLFTALQANAYSKQALLQRPVTLRAENLEVRQILTQLEAQTKVKFIYSSRIIPADNKVTLTTTNQKLADVLGLLFSPMDISYKVAGQQIILSKAGVNKISSVSANEMAAVVDQALIDQTLTGKVTDEKGGGLPGVTVLLKGSTIGTTTDPEGNYSLTVPDAGGTLVFSFIGFLTKEITVRESGTYNVVLATDAKALEEVVVIGYGAVKRRDLTGSVYSVKADEILQTPTHNAVEAIQGRVPGADILRSSGTPGASSTVSIRGNRSITSRENLAERNGPLYVIDGYQGGSINDLNPNDIESIEVLKDASSTAIYGALGGNGVIIVTTKKGAAGKARVDYNGYYGFSDYSFPQSRIGDDYVRLRREAARTTGLWTSEADDAVIFDAAGEYAALQAGQWVDWVDEVKQNGMQQSHAVSVRGGTEKTRMFGSAGYFREEGMLRNNDFTRYNGRFNIDQTISKWAKAGILSQVTYSIQNNRRDPLSQALSISPLGMPYDENGVIQQFPLGDATTVSPLADERTSYISRDNNIRTNVMANAYLELAPLAGLTFRSNFGSNINFNRRGIYNDATSLAQSNTRLSVASSNTVFGRYFNWDNILTYTKAIADHSITLTGITSYIQSDQDELYASGNSQILSSQLYYGLDATSTSVTRTIRSPYTGWNNMAYAGRVNYSFKGKYLFTASGRYDGASRLSAGKKWDFFPSAAVGWNISDETFLQGFTPISNLKLRASYGVTGNYSVDVYGTQSLLTPGINMSFGDVPAPMYQFSGLVGNPNLGWEKSATTDIGLDFGFLNNRISGAVDWYNTKTSDILYARSLPISSGVSSVNENIAATQNKGIELSLTSQNFQGNDFRWSTTVTFTRNREKITELVNGTDIIVNEDNSLLLDRPISSFRTYTKLGIWQTDEADEAAKYKIGTYAFKPGDIKVADLNNDFIIDAKDLGYIGSTVPKWLGGLQNNFSYKAFDLNVFLFARYGQTIKAEFLGRYNSAGTGNGPAMLDYWTPENPTNDYPQPRRGTTLSTYAGYTGYQALSYVDGSYFKIRNLTLGYTLPAAIASRFLIANLRVYATGSNLLTVTKSRLLKDYDPERGGAESSPMSRQIIFGLNVGF